jgi:hypothetical protein
MPAFGADAGQQVFDVFTDLASALSAGNAGAFLDVFDRSMPGYEKLRANVTGLLLQAQVQTSIEFLKNEGTDTARAVEVDWFLQAGVTRRREVVKCRVERVRKKWKIFALAPVDFFAPPAQ